MLYIYVFHLYVIELFWGNKFWVIYKHSTKAYIGHVCVCEREERERDFNVVKTIPRCKQNTSDLLLLIEKKSTN